MNLSIEHLRSLCNDETIMMTNHVFNRMIERSIEYNDIKNAVFVGKIIEQYPDDFPYPSCLVSGRTKNNVPLHIVVGITEDSMWVITAYYPSDEEWENNYEIRKEH